jgi:hypothetical protein
MATASKRSSTHRQFFNLCIEESKKKGEFRIHPCAMRCLQDVIDDMEGEAESLPLAIEVIFAGICEMKSRETSNRKKKNVYRKDVVAWFAPPAAGEEDVLEWECPDENPEEKLHAVRKVLNFTIENGKEFFLVDWKPTWEQRSNLSLKMVVAFKKHRRMMVERRYIEAEAEEAGRAKKRSRLE